MKSNITDPEAKEPKIPICEQKATAYTKFVHADATEEEGENLKMAFHAGALWMNSLMNSALHKAPHERLDLLQAIDYDLNQHLVKKGWSAFQAMINKPAV